MAETLRDQILSTDEFGFPVIPTKEDVQELVQSLRNQARAAEASGKEGSAKIIRQEAIDVERNAII